jgi:hypothetical protein
VNIFVFSHFRSARKLLTFKVIWLSLVVVTCSSCAIFRAGGDTIEAIGEGASTALVGVASGTGHAIAGTGRAISSAAGSTSQSITDYSESTQRDDRLVF